MYGCRHGSSCVEALIQVKSLMWYQANSQIHIRFGVCSFYYSGALLMGVDKKKKTLHARVTHQSKITFDVALSNTCKTGQFLAHFSAVEMVAWI